MFAFEDSYRAIAETVAESILSLRPQAEVIIVEPVMLGQELARLDPGLVISSRPEITSPKTPVAWVQLSPQPENTSMIRIGDRRRETENPSLDELLSVFDEAEKLVEKARQ